MCSGTLGPPAPQYNTRGRERARARAEYRRGQPPPRVGALFGSYSNIPPKQGPQGTKGPEITPYGGSTLLLLTAKYGMVN